VCEGASEVGLLRGLDDYRVGQGKIGLNASGVAYFDAEGSNPDKCIGQASVLLGLGFRAMAFIDNDKPPTEAIRDAFVEKGGKLVTWREGFSLEDELFSSMPDEAIRALIERAKELTEDGLVANHILSKSDGKIELNTIEAELFNSGFTHESRKLLGQAARIKKAGWFKSISKMEGVAHDIISPHLNQSDNHFKDTLEELFDWAHGAA
jgi:putative ATP-dependent endonuclease of the OLD family